MPCLPLSSSPSPSPHFFSCDSQCRGHHTTHEVSTNNGHHVKLAGSCAWLCACSQDTQSLCLIWAMGPASPWLWPVLSSRGVSQEGDVKWIKQMCQHWSKEKCQHSTSSYTPPQHSWPPMNIYARISQPQQHGHLGQMIWAVLSIRGYLEASLTSKHLIPTAPSPPIWENQKCLQTLSNVLWKAKIGPGWESVST